MLWGREELTTVVMLGKANNAGRIENDYLWGRQFYMRGIRHLAWFLFFCSEDSGSS